MNLRPIFTRDFFKFLRLENAILVIISIWVYIYISGSTIYLDFGTINVILIATLSLISGNIINDVYDLEIDRINKPDRLLASGKLPIKGAYILYFLILTCVLLVSLNLNIESFYLIVVNNILLYLYSKYFKRVELIGNIIVSYLAASIFLLSELALNISGPLFIIFIFTFMIHLIREILKDIEDVQGDTQIGIRTLPIVYGLNNSKKLIYVLLFIYTCFDVYLIYIVGTLYFTISIVILVIIPSVFLILQLVKSQNKNEFSFTSNFAKLQMVLGLIFLIFNKYDITQIKLSFY